MYAISESCALAYAICIHEPHSSRDLSSACSLSESESKSETPLMNLLNEANEANNAEAAAAARSNIEGNASVQ